MPNINIAALASETPTMSDKIVFIDTSADPDDLNLAELSAVRSAMFASGDIDGGGLSSFEIPNSAAPTVNADGEIAVDTTVTDFSHGILKYYGGEEMAVIAVPVAGLSGLTNGLVLAYNATTDECEFVAPSGGGIGGSTGSTDNAILRADGAGGSTVQSSSATVSDAGDVLAASGRYFMVAGSDILFGNVLGTGDSVINYNSGLALKIRDNGGAINLQVDSNSTAGNTRLLVYDVDNATLERVSVGAADSGGSGYKLLRIPN